ncbi:hypothetical protein JCGZ_25559 [Jatropha curcas]|uniref:Uncharacterized protein n=2 Tax=Jatropha curcas TaxID=180498 RepID=A0A067JP92_JATCU|nr:hypothetical protein JCGZ_25559 [Jatropha curcas]
MAFAYGFMFAFVAFTIFLAFNPSPNSSALWFTNIFTTTTPTPTAPSDSYGSQFSSIFSNFWPNGTNSSFPTNNATRSNTTSSQLPTSNDEVQTPLTVQKPAVLRTNQSVDASIVNNQTQILENSNKTAISTPISPVSAEQTANLTTIPVSAEQAANLTTSPVSVSPMKSNQGSNSADKSGLASPVRENQDAIPVSDSPEKSNQSSNSNAKSGLATPVQENQNAKSSTNSVSSVKGKQEKGIAEKNVASNYTSSLSKKQNNGSKQSNGTNSELSGKQGIESLVNCNFFDGEWVKDDSYPLYKPGSCSLIDEQFNCISNGRPDKDYQKYKWKPKGCTLPRLNPAKMLDMLRGKRLVFVGDSLNRNMWESLVCMLKGSVKDQSKVFEANGRVHFRGEASYSFVFKDYDCTIEFFVSPFLVQEWEMPDKNGTKRETLRLDLVGRSSDLYKNADIIIFNTGHWWTHDKTSKGKDYYQEGSHIYNELNVLEAFRKALTTWARWVDHNVNPMKSLVFFRGYSASHFSGGQWNSGGACDSEVEPINNATYLRQYPPKMLVLERVLRGMKTHVTYLNVTQMTDYRKDGHPSIYRKRNIPPEERKSPLHFQDCSHWCLPGVPDTWNEILYAELLISEYQKRRVQKKHR